jgi:predicted nucleotidyltransferase
MVSISAELIDRMARRIVAEVDPEKIVLFGSWARGEASEQSDVDFLAIDQWKDSRYQVVGRALREGKVLYESDRRTS